jgi:hypothetical protein
VTAQPTDERLLAATVREHHNSRPAGPVRQKDRDRTALARLLDRADMDPDEIADVVGIRPWQLPAVLRGERAPA